MRSPPPCPTAPTTPPRARRPPRRRTTTNTNPPPPPTAQPPPMPTRPTPDAHQPGCSPLCPLPLTYEETIGSHRQKGDRDRRCGQRFSVILRASEETRTAIILHPSDGLRQPVGGKEKHARSAPLWRDTGGRMRTATSSALGAVRRERCPRSLSPASIPRPQQSSRRTAAARQVRKAGPGWRKPRARTFLTPTPPPRERLGRYWRRGRER